MFGTLLNNEIHQMLHSRKFLLTALISASLFLLSLFVSTERYLGEKSEYDSAVAAQTEAIEFTRNRNDGTQYDKEEPNWAGAVYKKPAVLSIFAIGIDDKLGNAGMLDPIRTPFIAQKINQTDMNAFDMTSVLENVLDRIDVAMVIRLLFSLMAVVIAFDMISGERERGVLKLIHANNVSRLKVITAKWCAGTLALLFSLSVGILVALIYQNFARHIVFGFEDIIRIGVFFTVSLLYLFVFYHGSLLLSCVVKSSHTAIVGMFLIWTVCLFILPNLGIFVARQIIPSPPFDYARTEVYKVNKGYWDKMLALDRNDRKKYLAVRAEQKQAVFGVKQNFINSLLEQRAMAVLLSTISPAALYDFAAEYITGTSVDDHTVFMSRVHHANDMYYSYTLKQRNLSTEERKSLIVSTEEAITSISLDSNRMPLMKSVMKALPFIAVLTILNAFLALAIIVIYDQKTPII